MIERTVDHVLVATDLSTRSGRAVQRAALIAQAHRAHLTVVHIVDPSVDDLSVAEARQLVEGQTSELDPQPTIEVGMGAPFVEIIRRARAGDAALIVLGARGQHSLGEQLVGTTAERVVRNGDRPVLVVRRFPQGDQYQEVLIGIDRSDRSAEALGFARRTFPGARLTAATICVVVGERRLQLAGASEAEMDSLHRATTARERERTEVWLAEQGVGADSFALVAGRPGVDLPALAERDDFDLVVVGSHGISGLRYFLLGSVAQQVLRDSTCDVLVVRRGRAAGEFELP